MTRRELLWGQPVRVVAGLAKGKLGTLLERASFDWAPGEPLFAVDLPGVGTRMIRASYLEPAEVAS